jgi:ABC-type Fe3+-hydroxamate transport system substrate-binding protein
MSRCLGLALVLAIAACSADVETATTSSSTTPPVTVADTLGATTTIATTTSSVSTTLPPTTTTTSQPSTTASLPFPPGRESLEHGGDAWVVVLAGSDDIDDPVLAEAVEAAEDAGYLTGPTDCDFGAAEALGQPEGNLTVSVYLSSESDAEAALLAFEARGVTGVVAQVQTFCLD